MVLEHGCIGSLVDGEEVQGEGGNAGVETECSILEAVVEGSGEAGGGCADGGIFGEGSGGIEHGAKGGAVVCCLGGGQEEEGNGCVERGMHGGLRLRERMLRELRGNVLGAEET